MTIVFGIMVLYFLTIIYLVLKTPKTDERTSFDEFYTGSKTVGGFVIGLVVLMTCMSGSTWTGWVGMGYQNGVFLAYCIPYVCIAWPFFIYFLAEKIWPLGKQYSLATLGDLYELRYRSKELKVFAGLLGGLMNLTWITMEIVTLGYILNVASNGYLSTAVGSLIGIIFMVAYTLWGGVRGLVKVNYFQSIVMLIGCMVCVLYAVFSNYSSITALFSTVLINLPETFTLPGPLGSGTDGMWFSFTFLSSVGILCYPSLYLKIYMGKDVNAIRKSGITAGISMLWIQFVQFLAAFSVIGYGVVKNINFQNTDNAYLLMFQQSGNMLILGIACVFVLAATMGTIDGTVLAIAGLFSNDVISNVKRIKNNDGLIGTEEYKGKVEIGSKGDKTLLNTRILVIFISIVAYFITLFNLPLLVWIAIINYQVIGQLLVPMLGAVMWEKATAKGAIYGLITGLITTIIPLLLILKNK